MTAVYRDAETAVISYLTANIGDGRPVGSRVPTPRPAEFYRVFRSGGVWETRVTDAARITVEAWAGRETVAAGMLNTVRAVLRDAEMDLFGAVEYGGPVNLPDPKTDQVRYTASFTVRVRVLQ